MCGSGVLKRLYFKDFCIFLNSNRVRGGNFVDLFWVKVGNNLYGFFLVAWPKEFVILVVKVRTDILTLPSPPKKNKNRMQRSKGQSLSKKNPRSLPK